MLREKQSTFVSQLLAQNTLLKDFRPDQEGNVAIVFCLMATVLMLAVGAAVVVDRAGNEKYTDAAPASGQYVMAHYTTSSSGGKGVCTVPSTAAIAPLTSDKSSLLTIISNLKAAGGTAGHLGTAWAWYLLSPNWASLWPSSTPAPYGTTVKKIAILIGQRNSEIAGARQAELRDLNGENQQWRIPAIG